MLRRRLVLAVSVFAVCSGLLALPWPALATFPGTNGRVLFDDYVNEEHIFVVNPDGTGLTDLTPRLIDNAYQPSWAPDGSTIAFARDYPSGIWVMGADGSSMRQLTFNASDFSPSYSPDGTMIAYAHQNLPGGISLMTARGTFIRRLTTRLYDDAPDWSPDGTKIAFVRNFKQIAVVNADGTGQTILTRRREDTAPSWSPDGTKIAFARTDYHLDRTDIWVMNADGSGQTNLTGDMSVRSYFSTPVWSPDGQFLVVSSVGSCGMIGLFVLPADGGPGTQLVCIYHANNPAWGST